MIETIYYLFRFGIASIIMFLGVSLFFSDIPTKLRGTIYDRARKCMGASISMVPLAVMVSYGVNLKMTGEGYNDLIFLSAYYVMSMLAVFSFIPLLGRELNIRSPKFIIAVTSCPIFPLPMLGACLYGDIATIRTTTFFSIVFLLTVVCYQIYTFLKYYKDAITRANHYYAEDLSVQIHWMVNSAYLIFGLEIICSVRFFFVDTPIWVDFLVTAYRFYTCLYLFRSFYKFMLGFLTEINESEESDSVEVVPSITDNKTHLSADAYNHIFKHINDWVVVKGYTQKGITIQSVSSELFTNRTYLSSFINSVYDCSFKVWVTKLRIEESKQLLLNNKELSIAEVAEEVGFSSSTSFAHVFKQSEGIPPLRWRTTAK